MIICGRCKMSILQYEDCKTMLFNDYKVVLFGEISDAHMFFIFIKM